MSNQQPEHGPEVTAYLEAHPLIRDLVAGYEGLELTSVNYRMQGKKFSPKLARIVVNDWFSTDPDNLSLNGVENWADFYHYLLNELAFHANYISSSLKEDLEGYIDARNNDAVAAAKKERNSRKRKP